jgi:hypothetical protein
MQREFGDFMKPAVIALTLFVQVCTVAAFFAFSGDDTQAYPMEAGYVMKDQNLDLVYYEGTPAQLTYDKMDAPVKESKTHAEGPVFYKKLKNLRCERRDVNNQQSFRCAINLRKLPQGGV